MSVGNQIVTLKYYDPANSGDVNRRFQGIRPVGIYSGGYLTPSDGSHIDLSPLVCEISDGDFQVRVETTIVVNLSVPFADNKPYVVLHWTYVGLVSDYMEILVVNAPADNDIVVGKCTYSGGGVLNGVIYSERTTPNTLDLFLKVEPGSVSKSIRVRRGRKYVGTAVQEIDEQYTSISLSTYSAGNTVYIYVDDAGGLAHSKTASNYDGKLLLAKIVIPNPFNSISVDDITDVRSFLMDPVVPDGTSVEKNSTTGKLQTVDAHILSLIPSTVLGTWVIGLSKNTVYTAATDGFIVGNSSDLSEGETCIIYADGSNPPTTIRVFIHNHGGGHGAHFPFCVPVKKGYFWKITDDGSNVSHPPGPRISWLPMGS